MTNAIEIAKAPIHENEPAADPFSEDVFGSVDRTAVSDPPVDIADTKKPAVERKPFRPAWTSGLPKVSRKLLESSFEDEALPDQLPGLFSNAIEEALNDVVFAGSGRVRCKLESIAECDLFAEAADSARAGHLAVQIAFEPTQSNAAVVVSGSLVHLIIDEIFGPSGHGRASKISPIEIAIVEFLAARIVGRLNDNLDNQFFSVGEASVAPIEFFNEHEAGAKACIDLQTDNFSQSFQVLLSRAFLSGLSDAVFDPDREDARSARLFRSIVSVPLRAWIGSTRLDAATLSFLEPGDVVIVEESQLEWNDGSPRGELKLLAGAGNNFVLTGELLTDNDAQQSGLRVLLKDISSRKAVNDSHTARFIMDEKKQSDVEPDEKIDENLENGIDPASNEISESLENLQLRLRVELAGKKISLREINGLHAGQVIDLERGPTDSVNLVTDGSDETVAVGELVDIEGRLGVRVTKVFL